jgi:hypothetical protein
MALIREIFREHETMLSENAQHFYHSKLSDFGDIIFLAADVGVK